MLPSLKMTNRVGTATLATLISLTLLVPVQPAAARDDGGAVAAGVIGGIALGAIAAGAIRPEREPAPEYRPEPVYVEPREEYHHHHGEHFEERECIVRHERYRDEFGEMHVRDVRDCD